MPTGLRTPHPSVHSRSPSSWTSSTRLVPYSDTVEADNQLHSNTASLQCIQFGTRRVRGVWITSSRQYHCCLVLNDDQRVASHSSTYRTGAGRPRETQSRRSTTSGGSRNTCSYHFHVAVGSRYSTVNQLVRRRCSTVLQPNNPSSLNCTDRRLRGNRIAIDPTAAICPFW